MAWWVWEQHNMCEFADNTQWVKTDLKFQDEHQPKNVGIFAMGQKMVITVKLGNTVLAI